MTIRKFVATGLCYSCLLSQGWAQQAAIEPVRPTASWFLRPYQAAEVPPIRVQNSGRLGDLTRAGILYLTAQDAIALALENNIDLELARYNPFSLHGDWSGRKQAAPCQEYPAEHRKQLR